MGRPRSFQGGEHLDALPDRHIVVGTAMEEEKRRMDLLSVEERALVDIEVFACPGVTAGHGHLAIAVAPVALAPVTGVVTDAGMRDGGSKDIRLCLEILCHEPTVARSDATDMQGVGIAVLLAERLRSLNDILCHPFAGGVDMTGGKLDQSLRHHWG